MTIYIGFGSNLGDRRDTLERALHLLSARELDAVARSPVYETTPVGMASSSRFLNAVVRVRTSMSPEELLVVLHAVEASLGRVRGGEPCDRTCDLDLLLYDDLVLDTPRLALPHPGIRQRRFVLLPLLDLDPDLRDPLTGTRYARDAKRLEGDETQECRWVIEPDGWGRRGTETS